MLLDDEPVHCKKCIKEFNLEKLVEKKLQKKTRPHKQSPPPMIIQTLPIIIEVPEETAH
jgi:hypothetical protein